MDRDYVGLVIRNAEGKFLTIKHTQKLATPWRFAGGKIEPGEQRIVAAARELKEELGVEASSLKLIATPPTQYHSSGGWNGYYFLVEQMDGEPRRMEPEKQGEMRYMSSSDLAIHNSHPACEVAAGLEGKGWSI